MGIDFRRYATNHHAGPEDGVWWHGTPSGDLRGGAYGLHLGTHKAATEAVTARIGHPAEGVWDGTREYGKTLLAGSKRLQERGVYSTGYTVGNGEDHYPSGRATYSNGDPIPMDAKPDIFPARIVGPMTNTPDRPHSDARANGLMRGQITRGTAKRGFYYTNEGEDEGSISAVVPHHSHIERIGRNS